MTSYDHEFAMLYDVFYADKPYEDEAAFVHRCISEHRGCQGSSLLDLACGTGRHAVAFARFGWDVIGVDASEAMLDIARRRVIQHGQDISFVRQDMRVLNLGDRRFDAIVCLFDSIGYVVTNDALADTLRAIERHLMPGGVFVFECWHGPAFIKHFEPVRIVECNVDGDHIVRIGRTSIDVREQVATVRYDVHRIAPDGQCLSFQETHVNRFFFVQELNAWLVRTKLAPKAWYPGYSTDARITDTTWHIVGVARKAER